jgi:hypothetical protein
MRPTRPLFVVAAALLGAIVAGVAGCSSDPTKGYSFASSFSNDLRTVHVPIFENPTFARGLEIELTDAIIKEIQRSTPWTVAASDSAQTQLTGKINDAQLRRLSTGRGSGLAQELAYTITVEFEWKDARNGKVLVSRKDFTASDSFIPTQGLNERIETGQHGAIQRLARDIVAELRSNW